MTIKEVEEKTGLTRSNIRFYEKEGLIEPLRNEKNGYRDYTELNIEDIKKIAYLRTLGISIEDIRKISKKEIELYKAIEKQTKILDENLSDLYNAKIMCERILSDKNVGYDDLDVEKYIADLKVYWNKNGSVFKLDSVSFFFMWGGTVVWGILSIISLVIATVSVWFLPAKIPVQWNGGVASTFADKKFIFAYPAACVVIRFWLRPFIDRWLKQNAIYNDTVTNYLTNYLCFIAVSVEIFMILFIKGITKNIIAILSIDTVVLIGLLLTGWKKSYAKE